MTVFETTFTERLNAVSCCKCGCIFGLLSSHEEHLRRNGGDFYCPNGHTQVFRGGQLEQLKTKLAQANAEKARWESWAKTQENRRVEAERSLSATKGVLTKHKQRAAQGVCPECNRRFVDMARHMESKHPDYQREAKEGR